MGQNGAIFRIGNVLVILFRSQILAHPAHYGWAQMRCVVYWD